MFTCLWVKAESLSRSFIEELQKKQLMWSQSENISQDVDVRAEHSSSRVSESCKPSLMEEEAV